MSAGASPYAVDGWVWVKQPDYPWWPAIVLDPAQAGQELPEGSDVLLLCGPSAAATLVFANTADTEQLHPYRGAEADAELIRDGRQDASCGAAIDEMLAATSLTNTTVTATEPERAGEAPTASVTEVHAGPSNHVLSLVSNGAEDRELVDEDTLVLHTAASVRDRGHRQSEKKHKKDKKNKVRKETRSSTGDDDEGHHQSKSKKSSKHHRHRRTERSDSEQMANSDDDDDGSVDIDGDTHQDGAFTHHKKSTAVSGSRATLKKMKHERQSTLEEYPMRANTLSDDPREHGSDYFYRKLRSARHAATTNELSSSTQALRKSMARCLSGAATATEVESETLAVLRQLTSLDVTLAQLQETGVGVAIGGLLRNFTPPVAQLAQAILNYWFRSLPETTQKQLSAEDGVDRCSVEARSDGAAPENELSRIGIKIYDSFTNEELDDAPPSTDVMALCRILQDALERYCDPDAQKLVISAFDDTGDTGKALRRLVLEGKLDAQDLVRRAGDLPSLVRMRQHRPSRIPQIWSANGSIDRSTLGSPTSPLNMFSPNGGGSLGSPTFGSPTGRTSTALYSCPHCGANDAYQSSYSVQAHDNMPDILCCKKCGQTWNLAEA